MANQSHLPVKYSGKKEQHFAEKFRNIEPVQRSKIEESRVSLKGGEQPSVLASGPVWLALYLIFIPWKRQDFSLFKLPGVDLCFINSLNMPD